MKYKQTEKELEKNSSRSSSLPSPSDVRRVWNNSSYHAIRRKQKIIRQTRIFFWYRLDIFSLMKRKVVCVCVCLRLHSLSAFVRSLSGQRNYYYIALSLTRMTYIAREMAFIVKLIFESTDFICIFPRSLHSCCWWSQMTTCSRSREPASSDFMEIK
jgi:hypothetical protein